MQSKCKPKTKWDLMHDLGYLNKRLFGELVEFVLSVDFVDGAFEVLNGLDLFGDLREGVFRLWDVINRTGQVFECLSML